MNHRPSTLFRRIAVTAVALTAVIPVSTASAGRLVATGHDADHHCGRGTVDEPVKQCGFFRVAVDYARGGAPDASKPVLVLDRGSLDVVDALDRVYGEGAVPRVVLDPRSSAFRNAAINTSLYSAVIVASSGGDPKDPAAQDLNEVGSTPDSDAINARAGDLRAFFADGGGIYVNSGGVHGDGPNDPYYAFLPITVEPAKVTYPFALTDTGRSLGLINADVNCCATHNTFGTPSAESALRAVDTDAAGRVVTLVADTPRFSSLADPPITPEVVQEVTQKVPASSKCIRGRTVTLRLKRPRTVRFSTATVFVNGKRVKQLTGRRITRPIRLRLARTGRTRVKVVVVTTGKRKLTVRRTYRRCA